MLLLFIFVHAALSIYSMAESDSEIKDFGHVVLITSPLFGHMIPLLDFAKRLSMHHHVTYIASTSKLDTLKTLGLLDESENTNATQSRLEFIGLFDGNDDDYKVQCYNH